MEVWNACVNLDALEDQGKYVWTILQTIESEWDSYFFVCYNFADLCVKCGSRQTWQNEHSLLLVQKLIFKWKNTALLSLFLALILKVKWTIRFHYVWMCLKEIWI